MKLRLLHPLQQIAKTVCRVLTVPGWRLTRRNFILIHEAEHAHYTKRRKEIWEALHPEPSPDYSLESYGADDENNSGSSCATIPPERGPGRPKGFAAATAELTGESNPSDSSKPCESVSANL